MNSEDPLAGLSIDIDILGEPYQARSLKLVERDGVEAVTTLVRYATPQATRGAVLYVHGFCDYFFQIHVAEHFVGRGFDFYALDLYAYGRSLRPHHLPNYVTDLAMHYEELDAAVQAINQDGHGKVVLMGHSTGGLITSLWAHERHDKDLIDALVLNSPWLDLAEPWYSRTIGTWLTELAGRFLPKFVIKQSLPPTYGHSLHKDHHGEWDYRLDWKPPQHFPVRAGWLRAIRRGHAQLHRGLDVRVPVLVLHSDRSLLHRKQWEPDAMSTDTVLDVTQIARWAGKLGRDVTVMPIEGGMHDLFLSAKQVRKHAIEEVDTWLDQKLPG